MPSYAWYCAHTYRLVFVLQLLSLLHPSEYTGMANSETYFGIHIPFVSEPFLPSPRKRWFRSRSDVSAPAAFAAVRECVGTHSSRRSEGGIHSSRHGEGLVKLVVLLPDHVVNARAEQPIPRPRTGVRNSRHGGNVPPWLGLVRSGGNIPSGVCVRMWRGPGTDGAGPHNGPCSGARVSSRRRAQSCLIRPGKTGPTKGQKCLKHCVDKRYAM